MTDGPAKIFVGNPCGAHVTIQPVGLAQVPTESMDDDAWFQALTDPDAEVATEAMATSWRVKFGDAPYVTAKRIALAVVAANAAACGPCRVECVRPCPVAERIATVEFLDDPILGTQ